MAVTLSAKYVVLKRLSGRFFVLPPNLPPEFCSDWLTQVETIIPERAGFSDSACQKDQGLCHSLGLGVAVFASSGSMHSRPSTRPLLITGLTG